MELNRTGAAEALGIDPTTLDRWVRDGAPVIEKNGKGVAGRYRLADLIAWRIASEADKAIAKIERTAKPEDLDALKARRLELENERRELDLAKARGELVRVDEISAAMLRLVIGGRGFLTTTVPSRCASEIAIAPNGSIRQIVEREMNAALGEWSRLGVAALIRSCGGQIDPKQVAGCEMCSRLAALAEGAEKGQFNAD
jgi:phage terminase Nu1 subunit (DNA packaging protein)